MKKFKTILTILTIFIIFISVNACKNCDGESPRCRIINNGTKVISVQIKTSGGNTENINNIQSGIISDYRSFAAGITTFTISVGNEVAEVSLQISNCYEYDIAIDKDNIITTNARDRNE
ncbi:MAG: hypothetical protein NTZ33_07020 [Bacteroidetes bacterium]|nr:hypothetical protein [Bacteroidota bacterium]